MKDDKNTTKDHADFQSKYNQSKNFTHNAKDEDLKPVGKGDIKLASENKFTKSHKREIVDAMDKMHERLEMTPGGVQSDVLEEE